jgi:hypothetical protein
MIGISVCVTRGFGTTAIGDASPSPSSTSQAKNRCNVSALTEFPSCSGLPLT